MESYDRRSSATLQTLDDDLCQLHAELKALKASPLIRSPVRTIASAIILAFVALVLCGFALSWLTSGYRDWRVWESYRSSGGQVP